MPDTTQPKPATKPKCNHLGYGHELCSQCGSVVKCANCGDQLKYDFWSSSFEDKMTFLVRREKELDRREKVQEEKAKNIADILNQLNALNAE